MALFTSAIACTHPQMYEAQEAPAPEPPPARPKRSVSPEARTSGVVGCSPDEITISNEQHTRGSATWTASCGGRTFYCSAVGRSGPTSCAPAGGDGSTAPAPQNTSSGQGRPLEGAAGFTFGQSAEAAAKTCTDAGLTWTPRDDGRFVCAGAPVDVGYPATTSVTLCGGKVCVVAIDASRDRPPWKELVARFAKVRDALADKYGGPRDPVTKALADCEDTVQECAAKGRIETSTSWAWRNGSTLQLSLRGSRDPGGPGTLWIVYRTPGDPPRGNGL